MLEKKATSERVISDGNAEIMTKLLTDVVFGGTADDLTIKNKVAIAAKTGTTQDNKDRWCIGYTSSLICGVWYGYEYPKSLSGSNICLDVWDDVMTEIHKKKGYFNNTREFDYSDDLIRLEYCADSGKLMTEACRRDPRGDRAEQGYFSEKNKPTKYCDRHIPVAYDKDGGVCIEGMCADENVNYIGMLTVKRSFPMQIYVTDAQYVWLNIEDGVVPETSPYLPFFNNMLSETEFCGISNTQYQFNRLCRAHFDYFEWIKKKNAS